jgi:hypothetical protein
MENKDIGFWLLYMVFVIVVIYGNEQHKNYIEIHKQLDESYVILNKSISDTRKECH